MAALTATESGNLVWQRVKKALVEANPITQQAFMALKATLAQQYLNPNLQILPFTSTQAVVATGTALGSGAPKVYGIYGKKGTGTTTVAYLTVADSEIDAATGAAHRHVVPFLTSGSEAFFIDPSPAAFATGISVFSKTSVTGTTASTGASTAPNGFLLVGGY